MACEYCFSGFNWTPYNDGSGRCFRTVKTEWLTPKIPVTLTAKSATTFSSDGARLYTTYNNDGTNNGSFVNLVNVPLWGSSGLTTQGALNRSAIWTTLSDDLPKGIWLGFSICIANASDAKTYYVGIGSDDNFKIVLDGVELVNTLLGAYNSANITSKTWHIYPVAVPGGSHTLEVFGLNSVGTAGFGCEVYNNTSTEIINANTIGDLNVIYTTSSEVSATTFQNQIGEYLLSGVTCPKGGIVSNCEQGCVQYIICEPPAVTPSPTPTNTPTPTVTPTPTPSTFPRSFYVSGCCDSKFYKLQSGNTYKIGDTLRISPGNFCYEVISEPPVPVNIFINDTVGVTVVTGCNDETCQPCPTTTAVTFVNSCKILTILDFNFECNTTNPSKFEAYDGTLSVIITGGTAPYYVTWTDEDNNVYYGKTISNVTTGKYKLTVVDYWGDFSGETTCEIVGPKDCDFNASFFEYLKPCYGCVDVGFVLWNDFCVSRPYEGPSGTTLNITIGDQNGGPDSGTFFYSEITYLPKPLTFVNYAQFTPSTSAVTISNGQKAFLVDGTNFSELNCSPISKFLGTFDSNWSGTAVPILTTGTTNVWRYNGGGAPYQTLFMRDAIKYNTSANQWVDLTLCLTANTRQLFHFFLAADDVFRLKIDGQWVIYRQNINYNPVPGTCPPTCPPDISFASDGLIDKRSGTKSIAISFNHVLPITLDAGVHVIEFGFADIFNFDVLNCCTTSTMVIFTGITTANLAAISNYNSLSAYTAFSTKQLTGTTQTVFTEPGGDYGYYCPSGSTMVDKCGQFYCRKPKQEVPCGQEIIQPSLTPYPTPTNTPTPTITPTTTPTPTPTPTIASCLCFPPFSASPDGSSCLAINTQAPTILAILSAGTGDENTAYGYLGARIYYPNQQNSPNGFNGQGYVIGSYAATIPASPSTPQFLFWKQRLNTQGIWVNGNPNYVGTLSMCDTINVPVSKIYYVGCAGDNAITVTINGTTVISQVQSDAETQNFAYWHIYPFFLNSGLNVIEISNRNIQNVGSYAAEIYDNTLAELTGATTASSLNIIFSTGDYRFGGPSYGEQFCSNFDCPDGFAYDVDSGLCIQRVELPCAGPTTDVCAEFEFDGGASSGGRTFNFINCAGSPQTVVVPQGDSVQFCVRMPYSAPGATFISFTDCEQLTPILGTLEWLVRRNAGVNLTILTGATQILNQSSSSIQSYNGAFNSPNSVTYTINSSWVSGTGNLNVIKIRICKEGSELYYYSGTGPNYNSTFSVTVAPGEIVTVEVIANNGLLPPCTA